MINNLQLLRAFAALGVVFYHTGFTYQGIRTEFQGVAVFFVISGFLMPLVSVGGPMEFIKARLTRVVPMYWIVVFWSLAFATISVSSRTFTVGAIIVLYFLIGSAGRLQPKIMVAHAVHVNVVLLVSAAAITLYSAYESLAYPLDRLAKTLLFIPELSNDGTMQYPLLTVGWTLICEMYFYAVYFIALLAAGRLAPLLAGCFILGFKYYALKSGCNDLACVWFSNEYIDYFAWGLALNKIHALSSRWRAGALKVSTLYALMSFAVILVYWVNLQPSALIEFFGYGVAAKLIYITPVIVVLAALLAEDMGLRVPTSSRLVDIGNSSYVIYLTHQAIVMVSLNSLARELGLAETLNSNTLAGCVIGLAVSIIVGRFLYNYIERPLLKYVRQLNRPGFCRHLEALNFRQSGGVMNNKRYADEFKIEAVKQITDRGHTVADVGTRLGVSQHSVYKWIKQFGVPPAERAAAHSQQEEVRRLKSELRRVTEERDILKKAVAYFAKESR